MGSKISGIYNQTTGPKESPKSAIKIINPLIINTEANVFVFAPLPWTIKPMPIITNEIIPTKVPNCKIVFLPNFVNK